MRSDEPTKTLGRFFTGLVEQTFQVKLGVVDPPLIDYVSELLVRFVRGNSVRGIRSQTPRELDQMYLAAESQIGSARRLIHRHIGDLTLFWAGLFPEHLKRTRGDASLDRYSEYCLRGKRAYLIASSIETDAEGSVPGDLLERLGIEFETCAYGLHQLRQEWERDQDSEARPVWT
jgi:hypothetical protein